MNKRVVFLSLLVFVLLADDIFAKGGRSAGGSVSVRGYIRKDGTYVPPHRRSSPDGNFYNNWTTKGNINPYTGKEGQRTTPPLHSGSGIPGVSSSYSSSPSVPSPSLNSALPATGVLSLPRTSWQEEQVRRDRERATFWKQQGYNFDPSTTSAYMMDEKINDIKRATYWKERGYSFDSNFMSAYAMDQKVKDIDRARYWKERGHNFNPDYMSAYAMDQKVKDIERAQYWKERGLHFDPNFMTAYAMDSEAQHILRGSK